MSKLLRRLLVLLALVFIALNIIAFAQAWRLTHFSAETGPRPHPERLTSTQRLALVFTGLPNPRPRNVVQPDFPFATVHLPSPDGPLESWYASPAAGPAQGAVALFHGYGGSKANLLHAAGTFRELGYAVLLVDQPGSGGSAGSRTTIGYREAYAVQAAARYLRSQPGEARRPLVLYGVSMGAAAIMRAEAELGVRPTANILECPYGTMRQTVVNRFRALHAPVFPVADLLVFWGGLQNGFWAYGLKPEEYARHISTPTLLMWGTADARVTPAETDSIFAHLAGPRQRVNFPGSGHEPYWRKYPQQWQQALGSFLKSSLTGL